MQILNGPITKMQKRHLAFFLSFLNLHVYCLGIKGFTKVNPCAD